MADSSLKIALVGNPNCGKSSIFNLLTGLDQKIANFPGVTVEKKIGHSIFKADGKAIKAELIDLPGSYSLYPKSPDECIPLQVLGNKQNPSHPDLIIAIADASNLKRSLLICTQVMDLEVPTILVLTMTDIAVSKGLSIDRKKLSELLGVPVVLLNARTGDALDTLKLAIVNHNLLSAGNLNTLKSYNTDLLKEVRTLTESGSSYMAQQLFNNVEYAAMLGVTEDTAAQFRLLSEKYNASPQKLQAAETLYRYEFISDVVNQCVSSAEQAMKSFTRAADKWLTHRVWGYFFFLLILLMIFQGIFSWAEYPMGLIESGFIAFGSFLKTILPDSFITSLLVNGVLAGLSGIVVFVPQIALLFTFIAILEDTGYMARISFITDKLMRKVGLNGRSIIPLISGVACAVPAIMGARTIQNKRERILTMLVTPLMSCSARIPVYTLLIALVIPSKYIGGVISLQALTLMGLYLLGVIAAIFSALILRGFIKTKESSYFIMEMPIYRAPRWNNIALSVIDKVKVFLFDTGKIIIAISIVLWALSSFGPSGSIKQIDAKYVQLKQHTQSEKEQIHLRSSEQAEKLEASYAGVLGRMIEPVIKPLGFDWKIGIALITSFAAREVFVGTMATIYSAGDGNNLLSVKEKMQSDVNPKSGKPLYTVAVGLSLMIFYAFAMQCMSTMATLYRETKELRWPIIQFTYMSLLAYFSSLLVFWMFK